MATNNDRVLIKFVQDQFRRGDRWCWETIIEEVASHHSITLDADQLTYAGGTLRTGCFAFRRNDARWRALCHELVSDANTAQRVVDEVDAALTSGKRHGVETAWLDQALERVERSPEEVKQCAARLLRWEGIVWSDVGARHQMLIETPGVIYGLWRLDQQGRPIASLPHYVGETGGAMLGRIERPKNKCHRDWWGDGKLMGVTLCTVAAGERVRIEDLVIRLLVPFCNTKGNQVRELWRFPRPSDGSGLRCPPETP